MIFLAEKKQNVRVGPIHKYNYLAHRVVSNFPQYTWIYVSKIFVDLRRNLTDAHELVLLGIFQKKNSEIAKNWKIHARAPSKMSRLYSIRMGTLEISPKFGRISWYFNRRASYFIEILRIIKRAHIAFHWNTFLSMRSFMST